MRAHQPYSRHLGIDSPLRQPDRNHISGFFSSGSRLQSASFFLVLSVFVYVGSGAWAQSPASTTTAAQTPDAPEPLNPAANPSQQKPDRVTTTVVVHGEVKDDYLSDPHTAASLDDTPVKELPLSVTSITSAVISDQVSR